ncbi:MAG: CPBP family intramembrane glutamic endopeptidase [Bacteroidota bacterium]
MECSKCQSQNPTKATYCGKCGNILVNSVESQDYNRNVKKISVFFFVLLAYIATINFIELNGNYIQTLLIDFIFAAIILVFYFIDTKSINKLIKFNKPKRLLLIKIIIFAPLFAILVSLIAGFLNQSIFDKSQITYYEQFIDSPAPIFFSILSIGLFPAIFEEIAFRGIVFNELTKITSIKSTIIISAILFTILHLSLLSTLWIFPIGLIFGYFRAKYRSLWYGIIGHFIYNSSIVLIEIIMYK